MILRGLIGFVFAGALAVGTATAADVVIRVGPPRPLVERRIVRPSRDHVWVNGFHKWDGRAYEWVPGRWERPPNRRAHWVAPRYVRRGNGYVFIEGRWR